MNISKALKVIESVRSSDVIEICRYAKELEDSGEYADAVRAMGKWWQGVGVRPNVKELAVTEQAEILSRVGALSGWLGSTQQIKDSQEKAKDLISEAASLFESIGDGQSWAETRSDLAVCYWRGGSFGEARIVLQDILKDGFIFSDEITGKILLRLVSVEISAKNFDTASNLVDKAVSTLGGKGSFLLQGKLFFYRAFTLRSLGEDQCKSSLLLAAVENYQKAGLFYEKAKHYIYAAAAESNAGNVYRILDEYSNAHSCFDRAIYLYTKVKDKVHIAQVYENKAQILLAEGKIEDAKLAAHTSVEMLSQGDEKSILSESLTTLAIVLSRGGNVDKAIETFMEAKEVALMVGDRESAGNAVLTQIEELQSGLTPIVFRSLYLEADELLCESPKTSTGKRLQRIARRQFEMDNPASHLKREKYFDWENFSLPKTIHIYEKELIRKALREAKGRVTKAAGLLGVSHQNLSTILNKRHQELRKHTVNRKSRSSLKN
jgi:tetratricopeptide (TPR) repeat protein